ncbi:MerR family transcriptional regulator [Kineococcus sp. SYSU DK004]|uniref:MerR family transcriptional regulator n=1 Tax=Kineococcus sp. SYSU DK004 TaxID=3383125 RepID=UPI003D7CCC73
MSTSPERPDTAVDEPDARDRPALQVGEVAERVGLSHRTVRYYDDEGLLSAVRSAGNYRLYSEADVQRMLLIRRLKPLGYSLEEMRGLLTLLDPRPGDERTVDTARVQEVLTDLQHRRDRLAEQLAGADAVLDALHGLRG